MLVGPAIPIEVNALLYLLLAGVIAVFGAGFGGLGLLVVLDSQVYEALVGVGLFGVLGAVWVVVLAVIAGMHAVLGGVYRVAFRAMRGDAQPGDVRAASLACLTIGSVWTGMSLMAMNPIAAQLERGEQHLHRLPAWIGLWNQAAGASAVEAQRLEEQRPLSPSVVQPHAGHGRSGGHHPQPEGHAVRAGHCGVRQAGQQSNP